MLGYGSKFGSIEKAGGSDVSHAVSITRIDNSSSEKGKRVVSSPSSSSPTLSSSTSLSSSSWDPSATSAVSLPVPSPFSLSQDDLCVLSSSLKAAKLSSSKSPFGDNSPSSLSTLWDPIVTDTWPTPPVSASNELISLLITGPLTAVNEPVDFFHKIWVSSKLQVKLLTWFGQMIILPTVWLLLEKIHTNDAVVYEVVVSLAVKGRSNHHPFLRQNPMIMWRQYPPTCSYSCPEVALVGLGKIPVASTVDFSQVTNEASDMVRADDNFTNVLDLPKHTQLSLNLYFVINPPNCLHSLRILPCMHPMS
ncbi:hypothetical protein LXL04_011519 [Taraxacum kok-saghyz]